MLDRWVNIFFSLVLVFVFILFGDIQEHTRILVGIALALLISLWAFIFNWLTIDGAVAAGIFGSLAFGLGEFTGAAIALAFFISSSLLSKEFIFKEGFSEKKERRDGKQVWSNGFWFALWVSIGFITGIHAFMLAAITAIAAATADTWATEVGGHHLKSKTWLITTGQTVTPGTDGGISIYGTLAALAGSGFIGLLYAIMADNVSLGAFIGIITIGFLGCVIDSYIGARFQHKSSSILKFFTEERDKQKIENNAVNWISTGITSILSIVFILIIGI